MEFSQQALAVAVVLGLMCAFLWYVRRRGWAVGGVRSRADRRLEVLERLALGPHHMLHLVRIGDEALLVASSPAGCTLLERLPTGAREARP